MRTVDELLECLEQVVDSLDQACVVLEEGARIVHANAAFERLGGWAAGGCAGADWRDLFEPLADGTPRGRLKAASGALLELTAWEGRPLRQGGREPRIVHVGEESKARLLESVLGQLSDLLSRRRDREQLYQRALLAAMELCGADSGSITRLDESGNSLEIEGFKGEWPHPGPRPSWLDSRARMVEEGGGTYVFFTSPPGWQAPPEAGTAPASSLVVPLKSSEEVLGTLRLRKASPGGELGPEHLRLAGLFAGVASLVIENQQGRAALEEENSLLKRLSRAVQVLEAPLEAEEIHSRIVSAAVALADAGDGLLLVSGEEGVLRPGAWQGIPGEALNHLQEEPLRLEAFPAFSRLLKEGTVFVGTESLAHPAFRIGSALNACLPLFDAGRLFGLVFLAFPGTLARLPAFQEVLSLFAAQAATALRKNELFGALAERESLLQKATQSLLVSERQAVTGRLAGTVAHHVRNPLSVVSANIQLMMSQADESGPDYATMQVVCEKIAEADAIIRQLSSLSQPLELQMKRVAVGSSLETVRRFLEPRCHQQSVSLEVDAQAGDRLAWMDQVQFERCLLDLCLRGLRDMPKGGRLKVSALDRDGEVEVRVEDDGPGIPGEMLPRIFEPFVNTQAGEKGLGLYPIKRVSDEMGARLEAGNGERGGSFFSFRFPGGEEKPAPLPPSLAS